MGIFGAIAGAVAGPLIGGIFGKESDDDNRSAAKNNLILQREWALQDREFNEAQAIRFRNQDRAYETKQNAGARKHAANVTTQDRVYQRNLTAADRAYQEALTAKDRAYAEALRTKALKEQRAYDRGTLQRLREEAVEAGFNPLTVLGATAGTIGGGGGAMVNPVLSPGVMSGSALAQPVGYSASASAAAPGTPGWNPVALPPMGSTAFLGEAIGEGLRTWFNRDAIVADQEAARIKLETLKEELALLKQNRAMTGGQTFGYSIPQAVERGVEVFGSPSVSGVRPRSRPIGGVGDAVSDAVLVPRNDGLTSNNQDYPVEFEGDVWGWARAGTLASNAWEVYQRNTMTDRQRERVGGVVDWFGRTWADQKARGDPESIWW